MWRHQNHWFSIMSFCRTRFQYIFKQQQKHYVYCHFCKTSSSHTKPCSKRLIATCMFWMVLRISCDQKSTSLIFRYVCETNVGVDAVTAIAGFKNSDLGRNYISPLEPLVCASLFGKTHTHTHKTIIIIHHCNNTTTSKSPWPSTSPNSISHRYSNQY